jgi:hypothetical protein
MSEATRPNTSDYHLWQWVTDGKPCAEQGVAASYREILVEVKGDLAGESLAIHGGLTSGDLPFLASTKSTPWLGRVPGVFFLQPVTKATGITITVRGVL